MTLLEHDRQRYPPQAFESAEFFWPFRFLSVEPVVTYFSAQSPQ